jgi:hypothetical protein
MMIPLQPLPGSFPPAPSGKAPPAVWFGAAFRCGQRVTFAETMFGTVEGVIFDRGQSGAQYRVSYWHDGQLREVFLMEADLSAKDGAL